MTTNYQTKDTIITTRSSSNRVHFPYRQPIRAISTYSYELSYGEGLQTLAAAVFGDDKLWWILDDMNKPVDCFSLGVGDVIRLPNGVVKEGKGFAKFF